MARVVLAGAGLQDDQTDTLAQWAAGDCATPRRRNSNGRIEWKVKGSQQSYHDWQQLQSVRAALTWQGSKLAASRD